MATSYGQEHLNGLTDARSLTVRHRGDYVKPTTSGLVNNNTLISCFVFLFVSLRVPCWQIPFILLVIGDLGSRPSSSHLTNKHVHEVQLVI